MSHWKTDGEASGSMRSLILISGLGLAIAVATPAAAQTAGCEQGAALLKERQALMARVQSSAQSKKGRMTPREACGIFGRLASNGTRIISWIETNGAWCQVPEQVAESIKGQQGQISKVRGQACNAASQQAKMEAQARQGRAALPPGTIGGDGITGPLRLPQGAL
jgi:hypothetical protein